MATARLLVVHAGPHCSVQDRGRPGLMRFGVPGSGPMDRGAFAVAQAALGNPPDRALIEVSLGGLVLDCVAGDLGFAVAGGGFSVHLDGARLAPWTVAVLRAGQRLSIRAGDWGSWACLALAGDLAAPRWLGSAATHAPSGLGGGVLRAGDLLEVTGAERREDREGDLAVPGWVRPGPDPRVVIGPQDRFFAPETLALLTAQDFAVTGAGDRQGLRLSGPALPVAGALDMPSEAALRGSVQVAGDGVATVLLADHQTTGGYPKIATILDCDLDRFVQLRAGDRLRFHAVPPEEAIRLARDAAAARARDLALLAAPRGGLSHRLRTQNLIGGVTGGQDG
jgi:allophanate hydrolase